LGRILRRVEGKRALLYEVVAEDTAEEYVSERRRQHGAYQRGVEAPDEENASETSA
jgi:superfamily II DNA or RNA helicase